MNARSEAHRRQLKMPLKPGFVIALLLSVACSGGQTTDSGDGDSLAVWLHRETLEELVGAADLVVRGRVITKTQEIQIGTPSKRPPFYVTESVVQVERTLKGQPVDQILVIQLGREGDTANNFPELPILQPNWSVLLFLDDVTADPTYTDGKTRYEIMGPEGLYQVVGGPLKTRVSKLSVGQLAASSSPESFEQRIRSIASTR